MLQFFCKSPVDLLKKIILRESAVNQMKKKNENVINKMTTDTL